MSFLSTPRPIRPDEFVPPLPQLIIALQIYRADNGVWPAGLVNLKRMFTEAMKRHKAKKE